jgi:hypothetical protein
MITVTSIETKESKLLAKADVSLPFQGLEPEGRMLVDSDGAAFVYLLGHKDEFIHLRFEESTWETIHTYRDTEKPVYVHTGLQPVLLEDFWTEIDFLLDNIEGNHNYGKEFVEKVERIFFTDRRED